MRKALVLSCLLPMLLWPMRGWAQVEDIENPGSVSAIQKRAFTMRHELNLSIGVLPLDAFYVGLFGQVSYTAHFSDVLAWTIGRFAFNYAARTNLKQQLERSFNVLPTANEEVQYFFGTDLLWTPFHGKLAVANAAVVHGEVFFILGGSLFRFTNTFRPAVNVGGGGRVVITNNVSVRIDVTDQIVVPVGGGATQFTNVLATTLSLAINFGAPE